MSAPPSQTACPPHGASQTWPQQALYGTRVVRHNLSAQQCAFFGFKPVCFARSSLSPLPVGGTMPPTPFVPTLRPATGRRRPHSATKGPVSSSCFLIPGPALRAVDPTQTAVPPGWTWEGKLCPLLEAIFPILAWWEGSYLDPCPSSSPASSPASRSANANLLRPRASFQQKPAVEGFVITVTPMKNDIVDECGRLF